MRRVLVGTLVVVAFAAAGCGGGGSSPNGGGNGGGGGEASKSATQILADAVASAGKATSFQMSGQITSSGQAIGIDLSIVPGKGATGSITLKGAKVDFVVIGKKGYMKGGADFWSKFLPAGSSGLASLFVDKWLTFPTTTPQFAGFTSFTNAQALFAKLKKSGTKLTNKGTTTFNSQSVIQIDGGPTKGTLYVTNSSTPYPVALVKTGTGNGEIDFSKWNGSVTLTAPPGAVDLSQLTGG